MQNRTTLNLSLFSHLLKSSVLATNACSDYFKLEKQMMEIQVPKHLQE